ncbi:Glyoxalase family protein [Acidisarcina polymorpha]|uniref:Glyoxalase family protein n=1 Tax=Acidisarcina polymorpha TaxID=2211140 RepID=A0A2Z5G1R0_9BACT|nr:VOC family protein [Acidisarcina polymorpha]AXC12506.1 Glyoxalase family protein [Acidisarcina polymorpha]
MTKNRSLPSDTLLPHLQYRDVVVAVDWLARTFGFSEHYRYGDPVSGAQIFLGDAFLMLKRAPAEALPAQSVCRTQSLTVLVDNVDDHFAQTQAAGGNIVEELHETIYGERQYGVVDFEAHHWLFSQHASDLSPEEWGATTVQAPRHTTEASPRPRFCYIEIPATHVAESMAFYEKLFGWKIRRRDSDRPTFDDAPGNISGTWVLGREVAMQPGLLPYIWVDSIDETLGLAVASGGEVVSIRAEDASGGVMRIATFRDPAGNVVGLFQEDSRS